MASCLSQEEKLGQRGEKTGDHFGEGQFHDGRHLFSLEGSWFRGLREAGDYYWEGQFHDGRHPVFIRRKVAQ